MPTAVYAIRPLISQRFLVTPQTLAEATGLVDQVAHAADHAAKATQIAANDALTRARAMSQQFGDAARGASDTAVTYIKQEPVTAILIAAAVGALLMVYVAAVRFTGGRSRVCRSRRSAVVRARAAGGSIETAA